LADAMTDERKAFEAWAGPLIDNLMRMVGDMDDDADIRAALWALALASREQSPRSGSAAREEDWTDDCRRAAP
jgi:hypothetical protein